MAPVMAVWQPMASMVTMQQRRQRRDLVRPLGHRHPA